MLATRPVPVAGQTQALASWLGQQGTTPEVVVGGRTGQFTVEVANGGNAPVRLYLAATDPELESVEGVGEIRAKDIREGLRRLQEINLVDRYLQT